jgi:hypothetical protein
MISSLGSETISIVSLGLSPMYAVIRDPASTASIFGALSTSMRLHRGAPKAIRLP